jgi:hypothetical protein
MGRVNRTIAFVAVVVAVTLVGAVVVSRWSPAIPDDEAIPMVATTALRGAIAPDVTDDIDPGSIPASPAGSECLDAIERPAGPMWLCWQAYRDPHDADPLQDYYRLRVFGTFGGDGGTGVRWASVRADLAGSPSQGVFEAWPSGVYEGTCQEVDVSLGTQPLPPETLCGKTTGSASTDGWTQRVTWTCEGCLLPDHADRGFTLHEFVAVPAGTIPTWEIFADLGG